MLEGASFFWGWRGGSKPQPLLWTDQLARGVIITASSLRNGLNFCVIFRVFRALKFLRETLRDRGVREPFVTSLSSPHALCSYLRAAIFLQQ